MSDLDAFVADLRSAIEAAKHIAIISHVSPDGDNLGSLEAIYGYLKGLEKEVVYLGNDEVPKDFSFLNSIEKRIDVSEVDTAFDLLIALDSSDENRFGERGKELFQRAKKTVNIDHHLSNTEYADLNYVRSEATSTGEVLFTVLEALDANITPDMATGLYAALSTDTGSFQYDSVDAETHRIVAKLYEYGCDHHTVVIRLYQSRTKEKLALMTRVLSRIDYVADGVVAIACCRLKDLEETGALSSDTEGIVEQVRNIEGVEMAVFLKEKEEEIKLSFRSKSYLNCTEFASAFDGGGHVRASGASSDLSLAETKDKVLGLIAAKIGTENR